MASKSDSADDDNVAVLANEPPVPIHKSLDPEKADTDYRSHLPNISTERCDLSQNEEPFELDCLKLGHLPQGPGVTGEKGPKTVLYLGYGSNLTTASFVGNRKITPLAATNVIAPSLTLIFDLPGIPYIDPCFANTGYRHDEERISEEEDQPLIAGVKALAEPRKDYSNPVWPHGMIGVVWELTMEDYVRVISSEGPYKDILVPCHPLPQGLSKTPPLKDLPPTFQVHTLHVPANNMRRRPRSDYAQPSPRYLGLLRTGAAEHKLPEDYQGYLNELTPYTPTTTGQKMGQWVYKNTWWRVAMTFFQIAPKLSDKNGKRPKWVTNIFTVIVRLMWGNYDLFFKRQFGDGERTLGS